MVKIQKPDGDDAPTGLLPSPGIPGGGKKVRIPLKKGLLTRVGYSSSRPPRTRRRAITRAVKKYGPLSTLRKLNAVRVLTRRRSPRKSRIFKDDVQYVQKKYY
jgi:hypothetical protein